MAQNDQDFECHQCGAHFDSREQLDRHTRQQHTAQAGSNYARRDDGSQPSFDADDNEFNN